MKYWLKNYTKQFKRGKIYARFKYNIWAADITGMELLSSDKQSVKCLLCVIDVHKNLVLLK